VYPGGRGVGDRTLLFFENQYGHDLRRYPKIGHDERISKKNRNPTHKKIKKKIVDTLLGTTL